MSYVGQWHGVGNGNASFIFLLEHYIGWPFVDPNTEALKLGLDDPLFCEGFVHVQNNEDEMASLSNRDNLTTTTFPVLGSLNDSREVQHLDSSAIIHYLTRDCG